MLTNQKTLQNGSALLDLSCDYNRNNSVGTLNGKTGNLTKILNNLDHARDREYQFDAVGRLTIAKNGNTDRFLQQQYTYDRFGNRTNVTTTGTAPRGVPIQTDGIPVLAFNTANNRITTAGFEYDAAGNQTRALDKDGVSWLRFEYDAANRMVNIKQDNGTLVQSQLFGVGNERIALTDYVSNQTTYFCGSIEYTEFGGNGVLNWTKSYTYLGDSVLSTITPNGQGGEYTEYNHPDRLGTRLVTNQAAGTSYEQNTLPFGTALNAESTGSSSKRFTSYERSSRTDLDYAQNRTYDSKQGRFTQIDPIGMGGSSLAAPQTLNLYTYCGNDPINHTDPSGLFWGFLKKLFKWILVAIAVIVAVLTIIAAPATIAGILGAISASAAAGSSVASVLGYTTAAKILGWIAIATGIGAGLAGAHANSSLIIKNFISTAEKTIPLWQKILSGISSVGALANSFAQTGDKRRRQKKPFIKGGEFTLALLNIINSIKARVDDLIKDPNCAQALGGTKKAQALAKRANVLSADSINPKFKGSVGSSGTTASAARAAANNPRSNNIAISEINGTNIYINHRIADLDSAQQETLYIHELNRLGGLKGNDSATIEGDYEKITKACGTKNPLP